MNKFTHTRRTVAVDVHEFLRISAQFCLTLPSESTAQVSDLSLASFAAAFDLAFRGRAFRRRFFRLRSRRKTG